MCLRSHSALVVALACVAAAGCDSASDAPSPPPDANADSPSASGGEEYTLRGTVVAMPDPGARSREIQIAHEEIPDFRNRYGEVVGMRAMTMPFALAEEVSLGAIDVGDRVEFTFRVDWDAPSITSLVSIRELPPDEEPARTPPPTSGN